MNLILAFAAIGGGLKFIDDAFDEGAFGKRFAILLAPVLIAVWITVSVNDAMSATILFAILVSVLLTGKIDNTIFKTSAILIILAALLSGKVSVLWTPFLVLTIAGIIDEIGNNYVDSNRSYRVVEFFFLHRFTMKIGVFLLCVISILPWTYFFAFMAFDMSYDLVGIFGQSLQDAKLSGKRSLEGVRNTTKNLDINILTTSILLCNEQPKGLYKCTFYFPGEKVKSNRLLSSSPRVKEPKAI